MVLGVAGGGAKSESLAADHSALFRVTETYRAGAEGRQKTEQLIAACYGLLQDLTYVRSGTPDLIRNIDLLVPLNLELARCRLVVAARNGDALGSRGMLRVATKYPRIAASHFGERGVPVEIIQLSGSVELAPVLGLSDCIVDLVETGRTLKENGLHVVEEIVESTARLVVNRASYQLKSEAVTELIESLSDAMNE